MRRHRGLTDASVKVYEGILVELRDALGDDPHTYTAKLLRGLFWSERVVTGSRGPNL
jgi:hypothetical protein